MIVLCHAICLNLDPGAEAVSIALGPFEIKQKPVIVISGAVHEDFWFVIHTSDNNINLPVVVQVTKGSTTMCSRNQQGGTRMRTDIDKFIPT